MKIYGRPPLGRESEVGVMEPRDGEAVHVELSFQGNDQDPDTGYLEVL